MQTIENRTWLRAIVVGLGVSILTGIAMIMMTKAGVSPFPKPPSLAFAEMLSGRDLPMPVGLLFHTAYVTFWSIVYIRFMPKNNLKVSLALAGALWIVVLAVFFPIVGWGFAGTHISPRLIPGSFMPHLLFGILLWLLSTYLPHRASHSAVES